MASAAALISAILASQAFSGLATSCGTKEVALLPCRANKCSCAELGQENKLATVLGGTSTACCKQLAVTTCYGAYLTNPAFCGTGKRFGETEAAQPSGKTAALKISTCCEKKPTITCADVDCKAKKTDNLKKKSGVAKTAVADGTCCGGSACTACCEKDSKMCYNGVAAAKTCAANHVYKVVSAKNIITAAGKAIFTDDANFKIQCCEAKATCTASPTCPAYMKAKATTPTTKCAKAICSSTECCDYKANICAAYSCGSTMTLVAGALGGSTYAAGATDAQKKSACCKAKPKLDKTCQKFVDAVAAKKAESKKGITSGAKGAPLAMVVVLATIAAVSL